MIKAKCLAELKLYDVYFGIYVKRLHGAPIQAMEKMYGKALFCILQHCTVSERVTLIINVVVRPN